MENIIDNKIKDKPKREQKLFSHVKIRLNIFLALNACVIYNISKNYVLLILYIIACIGLKRIQIKLNYDNEHMKPLTLQRKIIYCTPTILYELVLCGMLLQFNNIHIGIVSFTLTHLTYLISMYFSNKHKTENK